MSGKSSKKNNTINLSQMEETMKVNSLENLDKKEQSQKQIEESLLTEEYDSEQPLKIFCRMFSFGVFFQFIGLFIVCTEILLTFMDVDFSKLTIFYFHVGYFVIGTVSLIISIYLASESVQYSPLKINKSIMLSYLFTICTLLLAVYIFLETKQQDWNCEYKLKGKDCQLSNKPKTSKEIECTRTLSKPECTAMLFNIMIFYGILPCSGIPLLCLIFTSIKYCCVYRGRQYEKDHDLLLSQSQNLELQGKKSKQNVDNSYYPFTSNGGKTEQLSFPSTTKQHNLNQDDIHLFGSTNSTMFNPNVNNSDKKASKQKKQEEIAPQVAFDSYIDTSLKNNNNDIDNDQL